MPRTMGMAVSTVKLIENVHDDVIKWKHFPCCRPFVRGIHRSPVNSPHKGQWRGALMFSLFWAWINGWVNNREAGYLRRQRAHYDVTVMITVMLCVKFQNDWMIEKEIVGKRDFARFEFKMSFGRISYIAQHLRFPLYLSGEHSILFWTAWLAIVSFKMTVPWNITISLSRWDRLCRYAQVRPFLRKGPGESWYVCCCS